MARKCLAGSGRVLSLFTCAWAWPAASAVFWLPLQRAIGLTKPLACPANLGFFAMITTTTCDWKISMMGWMFTLFLVFLRNRLGHLLDRRMTRDVVGYVLKIVT